MRVLRVAVLSFQVDREVACVQDLVDIRHVDLKPRKLRRKRLELLFNRAVEDKSLLLLQSVGAGSRRTPDTCSGATAKRRVKQAHVVTLHFGVAQRLTHVERLRSSRVRAVGLRDEGADRDRRVET